VIDGRAASVVGRLVECHPELAAMPSRSFVSAATCQGDVMARPQSDCVTEPSALRVAGSCVAGWVGVVR